MNTPQNPWREREDSPMPPPKPFDRFVQRIDRSASLGKTEAVLEMGCRFYVDTVQDSRVSTDIKLTAAHSMPKQMSSSLAQHCNYAGIIPNHCMPDMVIDTLSANSITPKPKKPRVW